jgi:hypothetical protein
MTTVPAATTLDGARAVLFLATGLSRQATGPVQRVVGGQPIG